MCRRINQDYSNGEKISYTVPVYKFGLARQQQNRYDATVTSFGMSFDLRGNPDKGISLALELKNFRNTTQFSYEARPFDTIYLLREINQEMSIFSIAPALRLQGTLFGSKSFELDYFLGVQPNFIVRSKTSNESELRERTKIDSQGQVEEFTSELSPTIDDYVPKYWISTISGLSFNWTPENSFKWSLVLYSDRWLSSPQEVSSKTGNWVYSDETGLGLRMNF